MVRLVRLTSAGSSSADWRAIVLLLDGSARRFSVANPSATRRLSSLAEQEFRPMPASWHVSASTGHHPDGRDSVRHVRLTKCCYNTTMNAPSGTAGENAVATQCYTRLRYAWIDACAHEYPTLRVSVTRGTAMQKSISTSQMTG